MTDILLRDIDGILADRIKRVAQARGWTIHETILHLLERGLHQVEGDGKLRFETKEADVLQAAIAAMEQVPDDPGYSLIGRSPGAEDGSP